VKRAGDLLAAFFDRQTLSAGRKYSELFSSWRMVAGEKLAAHSRIVELERYVLQVEADHPGWIQLLQTRQRDLLERVRRKFPALEIRGISFRLSREPGMPGPAEKSAGMVHIDEPAGEEKPEAAGPERSRRLDTITDEPLKASLKKLEQSILKSGKRRGR
jgi:hypothetical protein